MTSYDNSPSGLDPKTMKPWAEMSEVERLGYHDLIKRRLNNRLQVIKSDRSKVEESCRSAFHSVVLGCLFAVILFIAFAALTK